MTEERKPQTWFIRLGTTGATNYNMYQDLAFSHNLIHVGYGIKEDIIDLNKDEIKRHLVNRGYLSSYQIGKNADLINKFINEIKKDDTIISPLSNGKYKEGKVIGECGRIDAFLSSKELQDFCSNYLNVPDVKEVGIKPAWKIEWEAKEKNINEFPKYLQRELKKFMPATVNRLKDDRGIFIRTCHDILELIKLVVKPIALWFSGFMAKFGVWFFNVIVSAIVSSLLSLFHKEVFEFISASLIGEFVKMIWSLF